MAFRQSGYAITIKGWIVSDPTDLDRQETIIQALRALTSVPADAGPVLEMITDLKVSHKATSRLSGLPQ